MQGDQMSLWGNHQKLSQIKFFVKIKTNLFPPKKVALEI
jgi:hypothetical protein